MLYIITRDELHTTGEYEWHTGEKNPLQASHSNKVCVDDVVEVQADGHELQFICPKGLEPFRHGRVVRFFGDHAKFIVANSLK